ncbi:MAG: 23S rRNA (adenine(2503)-C(2))-methyltransferase RlmN [Eggerthellaceae bacterium]|nr:23S rRNA (adenine(2503)-C(2))-methyltransferase RlmN [Eggerthellaceae bacterium]
MSKPAKLTSDDTNNTYNGLMINEIKLYPPERLTEIAKSAGQPAFRGKQLYNWLHDNHAMSYEQMGNLPKAFREWLSFNYPLVPLEIIDRKVSEDGTAKYVLGLKDRSLIETVAIPSIDSNDSQRLTICISTQAGCPMGCAFCATGKEGFCRNLEPTEIIGQLDVVNKDFDKRISNVVVMGQGEPFLNYDNVLDALRYINSSEGYGIGARHITVSTCGLIPEIKKFGREPEQFTLAVSLHSAIQSTRNDLMPRVSGQPLDQLKAALKKYVEESGRRVSLEYMLINGVNDREEDLEALKTFCHGLLCHVNLISLNPVPDSPYRPSKHKTVRHWLDSLNESGIETTLRASKGSDISGACGQLKNTIGA